MKVYIAGSITGNDNYQAEFAHAEKVLAEAGNIVLNPAILPKGFTQEEYMSVCIPMLSICDAIYLLRGWEPSIGANIEKLHAEHIGKIIIFEKE